MIYGERRPVGLWIYLSRNLVMADEVSFTLWKMFSTYNSKKLRVLIKGTEGGNKRSLLNFEGRDLYLVSYV